MKMYFKNYVQSFFVLVLLMLIGCKTKEKLNKDFNYFQKADSTVILKYEFKEHILKSNDIITVQIVAGSIDQKDAIPFNLISNSSSNAMAAGGTSTSGSQFQIDDKGFIEFPKIGKIKAMGLTKKQLADEIKAKLVDEVKNPVVIVKFLQFKINVLGEVRKPGVVTIKGDKANILECLAEAGDLTESGNRENVLLMREVDGKYETYRIDLRDTKFINSPAFQLTQSDVIYVSANDMKLKALITQEQTFLQKNAALLLTAVNTLILMINAFGLFK